MKIDSLFKGDAPFLYLSVSAVACTVTAIALAVISSSLFWSIALVAGTLLAVAPIAILLRAKRIEQDQARLQELFPYKNKIDNYDTIFDESHAASEKYQKLRQRLYDAKFPLNLTFEKIDELVKRAS